MSTTNFIFSGKVYCGLCGWKYRAKKERANTVYVCSKYSTGKNGGCERYKVNEADITDLVDRQLSIYKLDTGSYNIVQAIVVTRGEVKIYYTGYAPTHLHNKGLTYGLVGQQPEEYLPGRVDV